MKKTILLSIAASTIVMAGGDITPVQQVVKPAAIDTTWKFTADIKALYQTSDTELYPGDLAETGLFESGNQAALGVSPYNGSSAGGFSGRIGGTAQLLSNVKAGVQGQFYGSLGLGGSVFNDNTINASYGNTGFIGDNTLGFANFDDRLGEAANLSQAWIEGTFGNTVAKIGRMELDTPLLNTEKWNLAYNTFEALTVSNADLPATSLLAGYVTRHNGHGAGAFEGGGLLAGSPGRTVNLDEFTGRDGAALFFLGGTNKSIQNTTLQAWYYYLEEGVTLFNGVGTGQIDAYWLQADTKVLDIFTLGGQYAAMSPDNLDSSSIWALKVGADVAGMNLYAAYSSAADDGFFGFANLSTGDKTNIYTGLASIYFDGVVTAPGADTFKIGGSGTIADITLAAAYVNIEDLRSATIDGLDFSATTKIGPVGVTAIYTTFLTNEQDSRLPSGAVATPANASYPFYLGREIDTLRLIASYTF